MLKKRIAIYTGEVPNTTFIDRLIEGLAANGTTILLYGKQLRKVSYPKIVFLKTYSNNLDKILILIKYSVLLSIFKRQEKKKLDVIIKDKFKSSLLHKVRFYPVLYDSPDIFHLQWAKAIDEWMWVQEFGIKLILSLRGTHVTISPKTNPELANVYKENFWKVDGFHAVCQSIKSEALKYGAKEKDSIVIYSGLNLDDFSNQFLKNNENSIIKVVSVGRAHWVKGYCYALDAFKILKDEKMNFDYTIIGVDKDEELLLQVNQLQLSENVFFKSNMDFKSIVNEIQNADVLLLPSIEEGIANVVLEAMALGTIVVTSNCGGMTEVIDDGINGFVFPVRNSVSMANSIKKVMNLDSNQRKEMAFNARKKIESQHDSKSMISEMEDFYQTILKGK